MSKSMFLFGVFLFNNGCEFHAVSVSLLLVGVIMTYVRLILACVLFMNERTCFH